MSNATPRKMHADFFTYSRVLPTQFFMWVRLTKISAMASLGKDALSSISKSCSRSAEAQRILWRGHAICRYEAHRSAQQLDVATLLEDVRVSIGRIGEQGQPKQHEIYVLMKVLGEMETIARPNPVQVLNDEALPIGVSLPCNSQAVWG
jgi:hypothetical protein